MSFDKIKNRKCLRFFSKKKSEKVLFFDLRSKNKQCFGQKRHCPLGSTGGYKTGDDNTAKIDVLGSKNVI
jgi:hypothetical protein